MEKEPKRVNMYLRGIVPLKRLRPIQKKKATTKTTTKQTKAYIYKRICKKKEKEKF